MRLALIITILLFSSLAEANPDAPVLPSAKPKNELHALGDMKTIETSYEDTLLQIARDHNLGFVELRSANPGIDPWLPGEGAEVKIPTRHLLPNAPRQGIVINLPEMRLYSYVTPNAPTTFPIGIGREGFLTPTGTTYISSKKKGPSWRPTTRMRKEDPTLPDVVPPGPDNPLGTHALYLGWREYLIHGTSKPWGIGRRVSSGCIRMYPEDIVQVFKTVPKDTPVTIVDQPVKLAWIEDVLYIEAHSSIHQSPEMEIEGKLSYDVPSGALFRIEKIAGTDKDKLDWAEIKKIIQERKGYPIAILNRSKNG